MNVDGITNWRKSSWSTEGGSACVETGWTETVVGYRDSKHVGPELRFPLSSARSFVVAAGDERLGGTVK